MKFFDKWLYKKTKYLWDNSYKFDEGHERADIPSTARSNRGLKNRGALSPSESTELNSRGINFTMYPATGGTVIEIRSWEEKHERHINSLHVIPSDKDIGEELGKIITYEALKR